MKLNFKDNAIILLVIFIVLGAIATIQVRSIVNVNKQSTETLNMDRLKKQLEDTIKQGENYKSQITELENKKEAFLVVSPDNAVANTKLLELEELKYLSGLTDVKGPGVIVTLNDAEKLEDGDNVMDRLIHDKDVLHIINELRVAGAEAISINNERLIATSEQICAGPTIKINSNRYAVPYEIKAIGDPELLSKALKESSIVAIMLQNKLRVSIEEKEEVQIPKFANDINGLISKLEVINNESKESE